MILDSSGDPPARPAAAREPSMALCDAAVGQPVQVLRLRRPSDAAGEGWQQQLSDLGFTPGERAVVMRRGWPGNDPLAVRVGSSTFALRRAEAACVMVEPIR